jgi:hypothetical protein
MRQDERSKAAITTSTLLASRMRRLEKFNSYELAGAA